MGTMEKLLQRAMMMFCRREKSACQLAPVDFLQVAGDEVPRAVRYDRPLALLMISIDGMSMIRKADGQPTSAVIFQTVALLFEDMMRQPDRIGRLGAGELGVLLPETSLTNAAAVGERLRRGVEALTIQTPAGARSVTLSVGVAAVTPRLRDPKTFLMRGCFELRRARSFGGNRVCVASAEKVRLTIPRNAKIH